MTTDSLDSHDIYTTVRTSWATRLTQPTEYGIADALSQDTTRRYNVAQVIKRAQGEGRISHVEGMEHLLAIMGEHIVNVDLLAVGQQRRDWKQVVLSDGLVVARHPDLHAVYAMADRIGTDLQMYASW